MATTIIPASTMFPKFAQKNGATGVAIVLSGGGAQGDFEVGVLQYLYERGVRPDIVCGTSVGSVNGIAIAMGDGGFEELQSIWLQRLKTNNDMYEQEAWLKSMPESVQDAVQDALEGRAGGIPYGYGPIWGFLGIDPPVLPMIVTAYTLFGGLPIRILADAALKDKVDQLVAYGDALASARAVFNIEPILIKMRDFLLRRALTIDPASRKSLAVAQNKDGRLEVFLRGCDKALTHLWEESVGGLWSKQQSLGTPGGPFTSNVAAACGVDGSIEIFVRCSDKALWHRKQALENGGDSHDAWTDWNPVSEGRQFVSNPAVRANALGSLEVFAIGADRALWHIAQGSKGVWSDWDYLGGSNLAGEPVIGQNQDGRLEVFVVDRDGIVLHKWQQKGGGWSGWEPLGSPPGGGATSNVSVAMAKDRSQVVFARGIDRAIWYRAQQGPNGGWGGGQWVTLGGWLGGDPVAGENDDGRLEVFVRGTDSVVYHNWQGQEPQDWSGWYPLPGLVATTDPQVMRFKTNVLGLFCTDENHTLWQTRQVQPNAGWKDWEFQGSCVWTGITLRMASVNLQTGDTRYVDEAGIFVDDPGETVELDQAVLASSSIPAIFPAVEINHQLYVDGGVRDPLPIQAALDAGARTVFAVVASPDHIDRKDDVTDNMMDVAGRAVTGIMPFQILQSEVDPPRGWGPGVFTIQPSVGVHGPLTIDPGLIRIAMAYGYMRADDILGARKLPADERPHAPLPGEMMAAQRSAALVPPQVRDASKIRKLSDAITTKRRAIWLKEYDALGFHYYRPDVKRQPPQSNYAEYGGQGAFTLDVRTMKRELKNLVEQRIAWGGDVPQGYEEWWTQWEGHWWPIDPELPTPWAGGKYGLQPDAP